MDFRSKRSKLILIYKSPWYFLSSFKSTGLSVQEKKFEIEFQDGRRGGILRFTIWTILAIFDVQITMIFPSKFRVNKPFGLEG